MNNFAVKSDHTPFYRFRDEPTSEHFISLKKLKYITLLPFRPRNYCYLRVSIYKFLLIRKNAHRQSRNTKVVGRFSTKARYCLSIHYKLILLSISVYILYKYLPIESSNNIQYTVV